MPSSTLMRSQWGGKILDTVTRLHFSILASLRASSNEERYSLCLPTPLVKKTFVGTNDNAVPPDLILLCKVFPVSKLTNYRKKQSYSKCFSCGHFKKPSFSSPDDFRLHAELYAFNNLFDLSFINQNRFLLNHPSGFTF